MSDLVPSGIHINGKIWSTSNLDVKKFRNGDPIPKVKTDKEWVEASRNEQPAWCWASNDPEVRKKYGKLYNHYAVADPRGLAPEGWRIPTQDELQSLIVDEKIIDKINLPRAGYRQFGGGDVSLLDIHGYLWSSSVVRSLPVYLVFASKGDPEMDRKNPGEGFSVRCIKD